MEFIIRVYLTIYLLYMLTCEAYLQCKVPNSDAGTCMRIQKCKPLYDLYNKKPKTPNEHLFIQQSLCGNGDGTIVKVCCPSSSVWSKFVPNPVLYPDSPSTNTHRTKAPVDEVSWDPNNEPVENQLPMATLFSLGGVPTRPSVSAPKPSPSPPAPASAVPLSTNNNNNVESTLGTRQTGPVLNNIIGACGIDSSSANKISGGNVTGIDEYPWLAILEYEPEFLGCGGSLISPRFVLTAAHCLGGANGFPKMVRLGEYNLSSYPTDYVETNGGGFDEVTVTKIPVMRSFRHPQYDRAKRINDIGIVKLKDSATLDDFIKTICLPSLNYIGEFNESTNFRLAGWGTDNTVTVTVKVDVVIPFMPYNQCNDVQGKVIPDTQICAGGEEGKDSCKGDSGGPLMYEKDRLFYVVGVVSYGKKKCGTAGAPGIYTNVYMYMSWIYEVLNGIRTS